MKPSLVLLLAACASVPEARELPDRPPNLVIILADDMGWGDPRCFNPDSKIPTPHIDRLAAEGMRFTDAHAPGAWCVPSRYGLLTGRYPVRKGKFSPNAGPVIDADRLTLPGMLREAGYATAMVGKWHLGFEGGPATGGEDKHGGPLDRGFDRFFGIHASLDIPPYYYVDGRTPVAPPANTIEASATPGWTDIQGAFWREGDCAPGFVHEEVLPRFSDRAVEWALDMAADDQPFFLYLALASPHTPWFTSGEFSGQTGAGLYGEFVADTDAAVGRVLAALDRAGVTEETLVIFTSDNGPVWYPHDVERFGHASTGPFRGMKSDSWEGGHRMPFVARWPQVVPAATTSTQTICFTDLLATCAELTGRELTDHDSVSLVPALRDPEAPTGREVTILKANGSVVRMGDWKLIDHLGSGGFSKPRRVEVEEGGPVGQLYDLAADRGEARNLWSENPLVVQRLRGAKLQMQ